MKKILKPDMVPSVSRLAMAGTLLAMPAIKVENRQGPGVRGEVGKYCREKNYGTVLVVTGQHVGKSEISKKLYQGLDEEGIKYTVFDRVRPEPLFSGCWEGAEIAKQNHVDAVIAFGGGSVMDTAKIIAAMMGHPKSPKLRFEIPFTCFTQFPLITIPTTAGTGCEVTFGGVISDDKTGKKKNVGGPGYTPEISFLDVETTMNLSPKLTATSGMDALSHCMENWLSAVPNKECKEQCKKATKDIFEYLPRAYHNGPNDMEAREKMMESARIGGTAISTCAAVYGHALAHAIGGVYHLPHGEICGTILPEILRFYQKPCAVQLARLAVYCGLGSVSEDRDTLAAKIVDHVFELRGELNLPTTIKGMKKNDLDALRKEFWAQATMFPSPAPISEAQLDEILFRLAEE
jgi:alcohol dehydrogenase class IV